MDLKRLRRVLFWESGRSLDAELQVEDTQRHVCGNYLERCSAESAFYHGPLTSVFTTQLKSFWSVWPITKRVSSSFKFRSDVSAPRGGMNPDWCQFIKNQTQRDQINVLYKTMCSLLKITFYYKRFHNYLFFFSWQNLWINCQHPLSASKGFLHQSNALIVPF